MIDKSLFARSTTRLASLLGLALLVGCGAGTAFDTAFPDNRADHVSAITARLEAGRTRAAQLERASHFVVAVTEEPRALVGFDVAAGEQRWRSEADLASVPELAGRYVVTHEGSEIVVRELETGRVTSRFSDHTLPLVGAAGEGDDGLVVLSTGGGVRASSVLVGLRRGSPTFTSTLDQAIGAPAVSAGVGFVPWARQYLSAVDLGSGSELARVRSHDAVSASARVSDGHVFYGQSSVALFGAAESPSFRGLTMDWSVAPPLLRNAYEPSWGAAGAQNRIRLVYRPVADGANVAFERDTIYFVFYRLVFALSGDGQSARWARELPADVVGAAAVDGGLFLFDASGGAHLLSYEDGRETFRQSLSEGRYTAALASVGALPAGAPSGDVLSLRDQLLAVAASTDARVVPGRELAVRLLGRLSDPEVTTNLLALCDDPSLTPSVRRTSCESLAGRTSGSEAALAALARHADYLRGVSAPPVGPLAQAVVAMGARSAVPLLTAHLRDPETAPDDLAGLFRALARFGDSSAAGSIADFIRFYHAESPDAGLDRSLVAALTAYRTLAGPTSRELLEQLRDDPFSLESVRRAVASELTALDAGSGGGGSAEADTEAQSDTEDEGASAEAAPAPAAPPATLTQERVRELLEPSRAELERCLLEGSRPARQARVILVVAPDGSVLLVSSSPPDILHCVEPIVRRVNYPVTRATARQQITYDLRR